MIKFNIKAMSKMKDLAASRSIAPTPQHRVWTKSRLLLLIAVLIASALHLASPFTSLSRFSFGLSTPSRDCATPHIDSGVSNAQIFHHRPKRVAIIGAGASGSSAAWFLSRASGVMAGRLGVDSREILDEIVVFDKESRPGGRECSSWQAERFGENHQGRADGKERRRCILLGMRHFAPSNLEEAFSLLLIGT